MKKVILKLVFAVMVLLTIVQSPTVAKASPKIARTLTIQEGNSKTLRIRPKNSRKTWKIQRITVSKKKVVKVSKTKKYLGIKITGKKAAKKKVNVSNVKIYLKRKKGNQTKILTCKVQVIPANPSFSHNNMTMKLGETQTLKVVLPTVSKKIWRTQKVTVSSDAVKILSQKNNTFEIKAEKEAKNVSIEVSLQMKKKPWKTWKKKKFKKYFKSRTVTLKCLVQVTKSGDPTISKLLDIDTSGIKYTGLTVVYDGTPQYVDYDKSTLPEGIESIIFEGDGKTEVGEYDIIGRFKVSDPNKYLTPEPVTLQLVINKADIPIDVSGIKYTGLTTVYDGTPQYVDYDKSSLPEGIESIEFEGDGKTEIGEYDIIGRFKVSDPSKYATPLPVTLQLVISKAKISIDVSGIKYTGLTAVYDGTPQYVDYDKSTLPEGIESIEFEGDGKTEIGEYDIIGRFKVSDPNKYLTPEPVTLQLVINKADIPIDVSGIKYTGLTAVYDGTPQYVDYDKSSLPEGIESIIFEGDGKTDVGEYDVIGRFTVSNTSKYAIPESITLSLVINKATANTSLDENSFNPKTNQIVAGIDGMLKDITVNYTVNGETCKDVPTIVKPGRYVVEADFSVTNNYKKLEPKQAIFNVKRDKSWYQFEVVHEVVDNQVIIKVYLKNVNIKFADGYTLLTLGFDLNYDKSILEYAYEDDSLTLGENWEGDYNPDREHDSEDTENRDVIAMYFYDEEDESIPAPEESIQEKTMVCTIVYNIIDPEKFEAGDIEFSVENVTASTGEEDLPFEYTLEHEKVLLNPTNSIPEYTVYMNWDPMKDAVYTYEDMIQDEEDEAEKNQFIEALREYLSTIF